MYKSNNKTHYLLSVNMELLYLGTIPSIQNNCIARRLSKPISADGSQVPMKGQDLVCTYTASQGQMGNSSQLHQETKLPPSVGGRRTLWSESSRCKQTLGSQNFLFFHHIKSTGSCSLLNWWHFIFPCLLEQLVYCITKMGWMRHCRRKQSL